MLSSAHGRRTGASRRASTGGPDPAGARAQGGDPAADDRADRIARRRAQGRHARSPAVRLRVRPGGAATAGCGHRPGGHPRAPKAAAGRPVATRGRGRAEPRSPGRGGEATLNGAAFDPLLALRTLIQHGVRFVVIGGIGARLHGAPTVTRDTDICHERSPENLDRLAETLADLDARLRGVDEDVPFILDAKTLRAGDHFTFVTSAGDLAIIGTPAGVEGFEELASHATAFEIEGSTVLVASIDDLIRMKRSAGRPKDLIEVEVLGAIRDEIESERGEA